MSRRRFAFTFLLFLVLSGIAVFCIAENDSEKTNYELTVTADRLEEPLDEKSDSVSIITRAEIERNQWRYVTDALRSVSGLSIVQSGSSGKTTSLFLRGAGSAHILVLIDGIRINDPYSGDLGLENITTENIERIEVVKGPQSPLYGSDSIAGVINIITRKGAQQTTGKTSVDAGTFKTFRERADVSGGARNWQYGVGFTRADTQGQVANDEFGETNVSANAGYKFNPQNTLSVTGRFADSHVGIPFNGFFQPSPLRNQDQTLSLFGTNWKHASGNAFNFNAHFAVTHINFRFEDPEDTFFPLSAHNTDVLQADVQNDFAIGGADTLTAGYEINRQSIHAKDACCPVRGLDGLQATVHGLYVQNKLEKGKWICTAGARWDHHSAFGDTWNPRLSAAFLPAAGWKVRGSFGTGFRAPSASDLAFPFYGNPDLKPEKSRSWELGVDRSLGAVLSLSVTAFHNRYRDLITFDPTTFLAGNVARAVSKGIEFESSASEGNWHFAAAYSYVNTRDEVENHSLFRRPKNFGSLLIQYTPRKWNAGVRLIAVGDRLESDFRFLPAINAVNPSYLRTDVTGAYEITQSVRLIGRIENLLNASYEEVLAFPAPGISAYSGFEFEF